MNDWTNGVSTLYQADAREIPLPDASVHCAVTSPPYWGLRDYGLGQWQGGDAECGHKRPNPSDGKWDSFRDAKYLDNKTFAWPNNTCGLCGAVSTPEGIGLEPTLGEWVANIVAVMREVRRVLRDDGTCWLNLGDAYSGGWRKTSKLDDLDGTIRVRNSDHQRPTYPMGLDAKQLMGQPWRVAFALQDDGWVLRSAIVWHKPNPMPESVTDRPTNAYEMVFLLTKQGRYFYDAEAVREPSKDPLDNRKARAKEHHKGMPTAERNGFRPGNATYPMANARNVWTIPTQPRKDAHFATFPDELPRRCILAGTSEHGVCSECGAPWARVVEKTGHVNKRESAHVPNNTPTKTDSTGWQPTSVATDIRYPTCGCNAECKIHKPRNPQGKALTSPRQDGNSWNENEGRGFLPKPKETMGRQPTCSCAATIVPATVLDPFVGSGTTVAVAQALGRRGVGLDLNSEYLKIAANRIGAVPLPLIAKGVLL